jgi:hypothetical protein
MWTNEMDVRRKAEALTGDTAAALATIERALTDAERTGQRWYDAEIYRTRGDILVKKDPGDPSSAENAFRAAIAAAKHRTARRACAGKAPPVDRPPDERPRRPRAGARRLFADAGNARHRRGACGADRRLRVSPLTPLTPLVEFLVA